jgi:hypothetical protein
MGENVVKSGNKQFSSILKPKIRKDFIFPKKIMGNIKEAIKTEENELAKTLSDKTVESENDVDAFDKFWNAFKGRTDFTEVFSREMNNRLD